MGVRVTQNQEKDKEKEQQAAPGWRHFQFFSLLSHSLPSTTATTAASPSSSQQQHPSATPLLSSPHDITTLTSYSPSSVLHSHRNENQDGLDDDDNDDDLLLEDPTQWNDETGAGAGIGIGDGEEGDFVLLATTDGWIHLLVRSPTTSTQPVSSKPKSSSDDPSDNSTTTASQPGQESPFVVLRSWDGAKGGGGPTSGGGGRITHLRVVGDLSSERYNNTPGQQGLGTRRGAGERRKKGRGRWVIGVVESSSTPYPLLKIWDLTLQDPKSAHPDNPLLLRSVKIQPGGNNRPQSITTLALTPPSYLPHLHLALGLADGTVLLLRNAHQHLYSPASSGPSVPVSVPGVSQSTTPKLRVVHSGGGTGEIEPITGLAFDHSIISASISRNHGGGGGGGHGGHGHHHHHSSSSVVLFIVTPSRVLSTSIPSKGGVPNQATISDEIGATLGCTKEVRLLGTTKGEGEAAGERVVMAREEAIYVYGAEGREGCYAFEGLKSSITSFSSFLAIVSPPFFPSAASHSATVRNFAKRNQALAAADVSKMTVFDLDHQLVAWTGAFEEGVREVWEGWGALWVLTNDAKLFSLTRKPLSQILNSFFEKNLFKIAISFAKSRNLAKSDIAEIHKRYGDNFYLKGDYENSMNQYLKTLGHVQPSYVIRKFLDGQRISNLTSYLQELHAQGLANSDHTTLLLNCYTKLKDISRLDAFLKASPTQAGGGGGGTTDDGAIDDKGENAADNEELPFDLSTAIRVCRQAGFYDHAIYLARKYSEHEEYLRIQIEDRGDWKDAIGYIRTLGLEVAEENLVKYGRTLLTGAPEETTDVLIELCCGWGNEPEATASTRPPLPQRPLSTVTVNNQGYSLDTNGSNGTPTTIGPPRTRALDLTLPEHPLPALRQFFAHFVDHPSQFIRFLEEVGRRRFGKAVQVLKEELDKLPVIEPEGGHSEEDVIDDGQAGRDERAIWNTLLELYLTQAATFIANQNQQPSNRVVSSQIQSPISPSSPESLSPTQCWQQRSLLHLKALSLLYQGCSTDSDSPQIPYDTSQALLVCTIFSFTPGITLLYERLGMYDEVVRFWMERDLNHDGRDDEEAEVGASDMVVKCLFRYGHLKPDLYQAVLRYLTSNSALMAKHRDDLIKILRMVTSPDGDGDDEVGGSVRMQPIEVIQILSRNNVASIGMVKEFLGEWIGRERKEVEADQSLISSYRSETTKKETEIQELSNPDAPRIFQVTRCSACDHHLDVPSVHFMCGHGYHQRCLPENESECPNCARDHGMISEIRQNNEMMADRHDLFLEEVREAAEDGHGGGGFEVIAGRFSKGLMG